MNLKLLTSLRPYRDGNGLIAPNKVTPGVMRGSDNGVLYTSQASILVGCLQFPIIDTCIGADGCIHRAPGDTSQDAPDDNYGFLASHLCNGTKRYIKLPWACCQPLLLYMRGLMMGNPLYRLFSPIAALILALSNLGEDKANTSNKLLTWTTIKGLESVSLLCKLGGKVWTYRMKRIYGSTKAIAEAYYEPGHPFIESWLE